MRSSTASMILAFCAMLAIQAAPSSVNSGAIIARGTNDFEYDAQGNEREFPLGSFLLPPWIKY